MALLSYYDTGTASIAANGTTVTGQGTLWLAAVKPGDWFVAAGLSSRVVAVNSNTSLTIMPWPGAARATAAYEVRVTPAPSEIVGTTRALLATLASGSLTAFAGLTSAADTLPYFTGAGTMGVASFTSTGRAIVAAMSSTAARQSISAMRDQETLLQQDIGATRSTGFYYCNQCADSPAGAGNGWLIHQELNASFAIQRYVSVLGAIFDRRKFDGLWSTWRQQFERGSNSNGEYARFGDGTQICTSPSLSVTKGNSYSETLWLFPVVFATAPACSVQSEFQTSSGGQARTAYNLGLRAPSSSQVNLALDLIQGATAQTGLWSGLRVTAVGRWY